jgi:hypothetical protein
VCKWCLDAESVEGDREGDGGHPGEDGEWCTVEGTRLDSKTGSEDRRKVADLREAQRK